MHQPRLAGRRFEPDPPLGGLCPEPADVLMSPFQLQILLIGLGVFAVAALLLWSVTTVRYQITPRHLRVSWLGVPVRWIRLADIKHVAQKSAIWAERWPNVLFETRRTLVIRRRRGLLKSFLITPKYPFEFKATLEQAVLAQKEAGAAPHAARPESLTRSPTARGDNAKDAA
jgi:hypothetical protein